MALVRELDIVQKCDVNGGSRNYQVLVREVGIVKRYSISQGGRNCHEV